MSIQSADGRHFSRIKVITVCQDINQVEGNHTIRTSLGSFRHAFFRGIGCYSKDTIFCVRSLSSNQVPNFTVLPFRSCQWAGHQPDCLSGLLRVQAYHCKQTLSSFCSGKMAVHFTLSGKFHTEHTMNAVVLVLIYDIIPTFIIRDSVPHAKHFFSTQCRP